MKIGGLGTTCEYHSPEPRWFAERGRNQGVDEARARHRSAKRESAAQRLPKDVPEEKTLEQIGRALAECGAVAQDQGVRLQLEVHGEETSRLPRIRKILDYGGNHHGRSRLLELEPDGPARWRLRSDLPPGPRSDRPGPHARFVSRRVSVAALLTYYCGHAVWRLLLRRNSRIRRSRAGARSISGACSAPIRICSATRWHYRRAYGTQAALPLSRNGSPAATTNSQV